MDYNKLALLLAYKLGAGQNPRDVAVIAQALERAGLEARIEQVNEIAHINGFWRKSDATEIIVALRKRLEELNARS